MQQSVSWVMSYHRRQQGQQDRVGGLPYHMPHVWPACQICQGLMEFVGQIYARNGLSLGEAIGFQLYICDSCRLTFDRKANDQLPIHLELISRRSKRGGRAGVKCRKQPVLYISYTPINDSLDQMTFLRRNLTEEDLPDKHLRQDKIGGLFPYDQDSDGPKITHTNRMVAQFTWEAVGGPIYLFQTPKRGLYLYHYR